jgi:hypothetical protein
MAGSRSKKSGGQYDDPNAPDAKDGKDQDYKGKPSPDDINLGTGMLDKAKQKLKDRKKTLDEKIKEAGG